MRLVAERALTRAGYTVTPASDGEEGLDIFRERSESGQPMFDLVLSDVVMPGMDGPAMVRKMRQTMPGLHVLFMSGHAEEQLRRELDIEGGAVSGQAVFGAADQRESRAIAGRGKMTGTCVETRIRTNRRIGAKKWYNDIWISGCYNYFRQASFFSCSTGTNAIQERY